MVWTAPRNWIAGEVVSEAMMDTHVRDNFLETAPGKASAAGQTVFSTAANAIAMIPGAKYKTADEIVNNSTTLQNDDHLVFAIAANEVWAFRAFLYFTIASGDPGFKIAFTVPASCTGFYQYRFGHANVDAGAAHTADNLTGAQAIATALPFGTVSKTSGIVTLEGNVINSSNAGNVQLQWAQSSLVASNLTLKLGSYIDLKRLA